MPVTIGIYKLVFDDGSVYIGQSWNISKRIIHHRSHTFRGELFESEVLKSLGDKATQDSIDWHEKYFIQVYTDNGFTLRNVRGGGSKGRHSEATKRKLSKIFKGRDNGRTGYVASLEERKKMSESHKGLPSPNKGRTWSVEVRKRMGEAHKGKVGYLAHNRRGVVELQTGKKFPTVTEAARYFNVKRTTLNAMLLGRNANRLGVAYD